MTNKLYEYKTHVNEAWVDHN
ncbi:thioesterase, partial [Staphylococcus cohnii]